jgi:uncharacterized membrane protein YdbT with pleckstrin-like domain
MGYLETLMADNEKAVFVTRRHWVTVVPFVILYALIAVVIAAAAVLLKNQTDDWRSLFLLVLLLFPGLRILIRLLRWTNEMYVVTNRRVMEIRGIFSKYAADSALEKVNDVVLYQSLSGRMYDYGDVEIVTGSDIGVNRFSGIAHPVKFKTEMLNQKGRLSVYTGEEGEGSSAGGQPARADVARLLEDLDRLRKSGVLNEAEYRAKKRQLLEEM